MQEKDNSDSEDDSMIIDTRTDEKKEADRLKKLAAKNPPADMNATSCASGSTRQELPFPQWS